ncbi:MAG: hypothetical protein IIY49_10275 [Eubacterium sp.]|nr:hypothetical protein [Eubacterium sp.]
MHLDLLRKGLRWLYIVLITVQLLYFVCEYFPVQPLRWIHVLVIGIIYLYNYIFREKINKIWQAMLYELLIMVLMIFVPGDIFIKGALAFVGVIAFIGTARFMMKDGKIYPASDMPWIAFIVAFFTYGFAAYSKKQDIMTMSISFAIVLFMIFLLADYTDGLVGYIRSTRDVRGIPIKRIMKTNSLIILCIMVVCLVMLFLGDALGISKWMVSLWHVVVNVLKKIVLIVVTVFRFIASFLGGGSAESAAENYNYKMQQLNLPVDGETDLSIILNAIFRIIFIVGMVVLVIFAFAWIIRFILKRHELNDKIEDVNELNKLDKKERTKGNIFKQVAEYLSMEERARRIYKKRILKFEKEYYPSRSSTSGDIKNGIEAAAGEQLPELTELYNAIRYGSVKVDQAYLKKMKNADSQKKENL